MLYTQRYYYLHTLHSEMRPSAADAFFLVASVQPKSSENVEQGSC